MLRTYLDLQTELLSRMMVADNSTLYPSARIKSVIDDAYMWATSLFTWDELERSRKTSAVALQENYDYPVDFRTDTIDILYIDGVPFARKAWPDYREYRRTVSGVPINIFADFGRQYFLFPIPVVNGISNIEVWGQIQAKHLSLDADVTIFSDSNETGNEAVVKKAFSILTLTKDANLSSKEEKDAIGILSALNVKQKARNQGAQRLNHPQFSVPNFFAPRGRGNGSIANFDLPGQR